MAYFVHNPYFFANVTNQTFESTTFGRVFICNYAASSFFGFIFITLVIYMILFKSPPSLQHFRKILLVIHLIDLMVGIISILGKARIRYVNDIGLHSIFGIMRWTPFGVQMIVHVISVTSHILLYAILPLPLWYRDHLLRYGPPSNLTFFRSIFVVFMVLGISTGLFGSAIYITDRKQDYSSMWFQETPIPPVVVVDPQRSFIAFLFINYSRIAIFGSFFVSVLIVWRTYRFLKTQVQESGRYSKAMDQFTRVIFAQMLIPILSLFLPTLVIIILFYVGITSDISQYFIVMLLSWIPCLNSISTLVFIVPYRRVIYSRIKRLTGSSVSSVPPIVVTAVNSLQ